VRRRIRLGLVALAAILVACSGDSPAVEGTPPASLPHETILGAQVAIHGTSSVTHRTTGIEAMDNFFTPTILRGAPGVKVLVLLRNGGAVTHNFTLPGSDISRDIGPGDLREANVTFPASGSLEFYCRFHRDSSQMIGAFRSDGSIPSPK